MNSRGFTLIELLVVTAIIIVLTALTLPNYRIGDQQLALQRSVHKLAQDLRRAQEMAVSVKEFNGQTPAGYGIYLDRDEPSKYILFADLDGDQQYSGVSEKVEEINLEKNIEIGALDPIALDSSLNISFLPPDPVMIFNPDAAQASIKITIEGIGIQSPQYRYVFTQVLDDWIQPRANTTGCRDQDSQLEECEDSFAAEPLDPLITHDWKDHPQEGKDSKEYQKEELPIFTQKTIQINKAGLIAVE